MNRVSTTGNYSAVLANLMAAQQRQIEAGVRVSTQKNGSDLKDYNKDVNMLTAMRATRARLEGYLDQNQLIADKLTTQDLGLNQVADSADSARQAIAEALASDRGDALMQNMQGAFRNAVEGMNSRYGGKYLFAGGQIDTQPVSAVAMTDLTLPGNTIPGFFHNDDFVTTAKIDDSTAVNTGILASNLGTSLLTEFQTIQAFEESPSGAFSGPLTPAQKTFLEGVLANWDTVHKSLLNTTAQNGMIAKRVDSVKTDLTARSDSLDGMIGNITDADVAQAITNLQQAQLSVQAAAQVFQTLQQSSLLNLLK